MPICSPIARRIKYLTKIFKLLIRLLKRQPGAFSRCTVCLHYVSLRMSFKDQTAVDTVRKFLPYLYSLLTLTEIIKSNFYICINIVLPSKVRAKITPTVAPNTIWMQVT